MVRALALATVLLLVQAAGPGQARSVLRIRAVLNDAAGQPTPVPRHGLLISDNPPTAAPLLIYTMVDGTAEVRLRPGNYTVESDRPVTFQGKSYRWTRIVQIAPGGDAILELTADNAELEGVAATTTSPAAPDTDPSFLFPQWRDSVVKVWTSTTHASGFVIDARGLIATSQRAIGAATSASVEVQLTPDVKVAGRVVAADRARDIAVLQVDPKTVASIRPMPLRCGQTPPVVAEGHEIFSIGVPLRRPKGMMSGTVTRVEPHAIMSDLPVSSGSAGGPVFTADGAVIGIASVADDTDAAAVASSRTLRIESACDVLASAEKKIEDAVPPPATPLPVEPTRGFPVDALREAAKRGTGTVKPYSIAASSFTVSFITPVLTYRAQYQRSATGGRGGGGASAGDLDQMLLVRAVTDFSNWSEYVGYFPPVLLVRVTPKLVEGFWTMVGRGAARSQGVSIPPIRRFKAGFSRLRAFCGDAEVTPVHPFKLEVRLPGKDTDRERIYEGLYVFDPGALGPRCASVKLVLFSDKEPDRGDALVVDPGVIEQVWKDFEPYRAIAR